MRRINIYIDDELDGRAEREARRRKISKAALIRQSLLAALGPANDGDPMTSSSGCRTPSRWTMWTPSSTAREVR